MCRLISRPQYVAHFYGIVFTLFAVFYSVLGGMHSIVLGRPDQIHHHDDWLYFNSGHRNDAFEWKVH